MREINRIIIHCSASNFGTMEMIDRWHRQRGWDCIGYHFIIENGISESTSKYDKERDGKAVMGRDIAIQGAHCKGHNKDSIGICLIGDNHFSDKQFGTLKVLIEQIERLLLKRLPIYCHYELDNKKTCPNIKIETIEKIIY